jgi:glycolate oxidase iron-sulfur subunit
MQTNFTIARLADPAIAEADKILRACVHCGFCTATCPTYVLLGDERDSPRGRIYLIKDMLENDRPADAEEVKHIDRCLSCLSCMTTCPSGVHYMHLVDHARNNVEKTYRRPPFDRLLRGLIARVIPDRRLFRLAMLAALVGKPFARLFAAIGLAPLAAMLRLAPARIPPRPSSGRRVHPAIGERRGRVVLLKGCVGPVLAPHINAAAIRVLNRFGIEIVEVEDEGCCGALVHHMGREHESVDAARRNIDAWMAETKGDPIDAIVTTVSGCGTMLKDYGFLLRGDPDYAEKAAAVALLARDIGEYLSQLKVESHAMPAIDGAASSPLQSLIVAYHAACSLQHGQKIVREPKEVLCKFGFVVKDVPEGHLCCGSAGTYNMLQPELAGRLRDRKVANIASVAPDVIAAGNIGCITQIAGGTAIPVVHPVELIDWATGGPVPGAMAVKGMSRPV